MQHNCIYYLDMRYSFFLNANVRAKSFSSFPFLLILLVFEGYTRYIETNKFCFVIFFFFFFRYITHEEEKVSFLRFICFALTIVNHLTRGTNSLIVTCTMVGLNHLKKLTKFRKVIRFEALNSFCNDYDQTYRLLRNLVWIE